MSYRYGKVDHDDEDNGCKPQWVGPQIMTRLIEMMRTMVEKHNGWVLCSFYPDVVSQPTSGNPRLQVVLFFFGDKQIIQVMKMTSLKYILSYALHWPYKRRLIIANWRKGFFLTSLLSLFVIRQRIRTWSLLGEKMISPKSGWAKIKYSSRCLPLKQNNEVSCKREERYP